MAKIYTNKQRVQGFGLKKKFPLLLLAVLFLAALLAKYSGLTINVTPSMREGLYLKQHKAIRRGDIVLVCLTEPYKTIGLERLYIEKGRACCNGADPLIKEVIAIPGDNVILSDNFIKVNGTEYVYRTYYHDSKNQPLAVYPRGTYLSTKGYWVIGNHSIRSWDSRYWGPIGKEQILATLKPLLTW